MAKELTTMLDWLNSPYSFFLIVVLAAVTVYRLQKRRVKKVSAESSETLHAVGTTSPGRAPDAKFIDVLRVSVARDGWEPGLKLSASQIMPQLRPCLSDVDVLRHSQSNERRAADPENVAQAMPNSSARTPRSVSSNALGVLNSVEIKSMQQAGGLQVFGLKWSAEDSLDYATLDEALVDEMLEVTEISDGGQVPSIRVKNKSERVVFLMAGELLVGCKQDRVLNTSLMVPGKTEMPIPVACVEAGRWGYKSQKFRSGRTSSHSYLRMILSKETSARYRANGAPGSGQGAVWAEVARKMSRMGSSSSSSALQDMFVGYGKKLNQVLQDLSVPEGCHGAAFAINGKILGVDLFDKPTTFIKVWSKLANSYAMDALEGVNDVQKVLEPESVLEWTKSAQSAKQERFDSPGLGQDVRIEGEMLIGAALVVEQQLLHLQLFQKQK